MKGQATIPQMEEGTCHTYEDQERTRHPCETGNVQDSCSHTSIPKDTINIIHKPPLD